ncbi:MAG: hypothetical protein PHE56_16240 [Bacteroidales bacterium]|nr:hypothetical protein [Bacteroidales bacterium]
MKLIFSVVLYMFIFCNCFSQETVADNDNFYSHQLGIQYNKSFQDFYHFISRFNTDTYESNSIFAIRYGYKINNIFIIGSEIKLLRVKRFSTIGDGSYRLSFDGYHYQLGLYSRASFSILKKIKPFAEVCVFDYLSSVNFIRPTEVIPNKVVWHQFGFYAAPGISIVFLRNRINLDIMYKFTNIPQPNGKNRIISWRLCYNFNFIK